MDIQWYPGHMTKSFRMMEENIGLVDIVIELLDARIPQASKNPDIDRLAARKRRILVLNKADLADEQLTAAWRAYYEALGFRTMDSAKGKGLERLSALCESLMADKKAADQKRGRLFTPIRAMAVGIPNVGKSTLINRFVGKALAKTADRPGVTRGKQWIRLNKAVELLDTPGILWPKISDPETGLLLALTGAVKDTITDGAALCRKLIEMQPGAIENRYHVPTDQSPHETLQAIGKARGFLLKGGETDLERSAAVLLDEFRGGKLGNITLEKP